MSKSVERAHLASTEISYRENKCMHTFHNFPQTSQLHLPCLTSFTTVFLFVPLKPFGNSHIFFAAIFQPTKSPHPKAPATIITAIPISALTVPAAPAKVGEPVVLESPAPVELG